MVANDLVTFASLLDLTTYSSRLVAVISTVSVNGLKLH